VSQYEFFLQRDPNTGKPRDIVCWRVWMGGFEEAHRWPWDAEGCETAGRWLFDHHAIWHHGHFPLKDPLDLMVHADAR
jgi:hypothetical protein